MLAHAFVLETRLRGRAGHFRPEARANAVDHFDVETTQLITGRGRFATFRRFRVLIPDGDTLWWCVAVVRKSLCLWADVVPISAVSSPWVTLLTSHFTGAVAGASKQGSTRKTKVSLTYDCKTRLI
jgi:hypothetical protein